MKRRLRRASLEIGIAIVILLAFSAWQSRNLLPANERAPGLDLESLDGGRVSLESLRGKRVLVHFWATWCGVCRQEVGALNSVQAALGPDEALLTVVTDAEDRGAVRRFAEDKGVRYPILLDTSGAAESFRVSAFPTNYYLDRSGLISGRTVGMSTRWAMRMRLWLAGH